MKIRYKLLLSVLSAMFLVLGVMACLSDFTSRKALEKEIERGARSMLGAYIMKLDGAFQSFQDVAEGLAVSVVGLDEHSEEELRELIRNFLAARPEIYGSTVSLEPGVFGKGEKLIGPYYHRSKDGLVYVDLANPSYNYPKWDWYKMPLESGKPVWSNPYIDVGGGDIPMTTYSCPIMKNGKGIGVSTVDISLTELTNIVNSIKVGESGFAFLLSKDGTFLSMRTKEWELKRTIFDVAKEFKSEGLEKLGSEMLAGKSGFISIFQPLAGQQAWIAYGPISTTGWSFAIVFPADELLAGLSSLNLHMFLIALFGILAVLVIVWFISARISAPISSLSEDALKIAGGDFSVKIKGADKGDEVGVLARAFGNMTESLARTLADLRGEKEMFQVAFSQMNDGLIILDADCNILQFNLAAERLLQLPAKIPLIEHLELHFDCSVLFSELKNHCGRQLIFKLTRRENENLGPLHVACVIAPIFNENGQQLKEMVFSARDVTALEVEERSKRDFLSLMSHKLFTPLTVMEGKLMLFKDGLLGELAEKQQRSINSIADQVGKLKGLIEKLVNFVTIEESNFDKSRETIDMDLFLGELTKESEKWFPDKHPQVQFKADPLVAKMSFNKKYLRLIVGQLVDNGLKFNLSDPAIVNVECKMEDKNVVIAVEDNGIGIPSEYTEKIFEKFFQIEKYYTGNIEGVGLGLAYVRKLVDSFGGSVSVKSEPGKGSIFVIKLPYVSMG